MRRVKLEQERALRSVMERRLARRRLHMRLLAVLALLLLLLAALVMFLMHTHAPAATVLATSAERGYEDDAHRDADVVSGIEKVRLSMRSTQPMLPTAPRTSPFNRNVRT